MDSTEGGKDQKEEPLKAVFQRVKGVLEGYKEREKKMLRIIKDQRAEIE